MPRASSLALSGRTGAFSTLCVDSTSSARSACEADRGQRGRGGEHARPQATRSSAQIPPQETSGPTAPHLLPPWPHTCHRSPRSLCPCAWGRWAQAVPGPGPSLVGSSAVWRTPLRTKHCNWVRWAVAAGALGLESPAAGHSATQRNPANQAETAGRPMACSR